MILGLSRGELGLTVFVFALVYSAGLLPKLAARLADAFGPKSGE